MNLKVLSCHQEVVIQFEQIVYGKLARKKI